MQSEAALFHAGCISLPAQAASAGDGASCDSDQFQVAIALPQAITVQQVCQITRAAADCAWQFYEGLGQQLSPGEPKLLSGLSQVGMFAPDTQLGQLQAEAEVPCST